MSVGETFTKLLAAIVGVGLVYTIMSKTGAADVIIRLGLALRSALLGAQGLPVR